LLSSPISVVQIVSQVVLPVVARKKGLDGYYEKTDGNAQQKKAPTAIAPVRTFKLVISRWYAER
jgi:heme exporter protein D